MSIDRMQGWSGMIRRIDAQRNRAEANPMARAEPTILPTPTINWRAFEYYEPLQRVKEYLERNLSRPLPASEAAHIAGLNASYFSSFFRSKVGVRYTQWTHRVRVERAKLLLRTADHTIVEVARAVGFNDLRTFERAFKRNTGATAWQYKRRVRPGGIPRSAGPDH